MGAREIWKKLNEGYLGYIFYILLGVFAAFVFINVLSVGLETRSPVVAVLSGSMDHGINDEPGNNAYPCGVQVENYIESFEAWWSLCSNTYGIFDITSEDFEKFPIRNGFKRGDVPIIQGADSYRVGDVVVYDLPGQDIPIIHRIVKINKDGTYQTKGDHNAEQNEYEKSVGKEQIRGKVLFVIPKIGYLRVLIPL